MIVGRIVGWILIVMAIGVAGHEIIASLQLPTGGYHFFAFGQLWAAINRASLTLAQAGIQRHVWPWLWDGVIVQILLAPAWLILGVPGVLLAWFCRRHHRR